MRNKKIENSSPFFADVPECRISIVSDITQHYTEKHYTEEDIRFFIQSLSKIKEHEIDAGMSLAWELSQPAPQGCKTIKQLRREHELLNINSNKKD